ncbi:hypothetical protein F5B22DRAFT_651149 [Xylaria bambusicola]|uniref:uncharacterized protein n=1 Tax=Xylaria bambusicola TaxID=326684 RepID=UPI002008418A|nr:uncharacterized protein F5B22DRAFT_651149 [Xylaria bambusicola]KAI0505985.1 hypothetical protein F5B22DRAFT_651149 [Xylaria bambusicola]
MESLQEQTWLDKLDELLNVDVDWMDPEYIKNMPIKPHDQTSNQLWVNIELHRPSNAQLLQKVAQELKDEGWLAVYTRISVLMCKKNIDNIRGRVLLQTIPSKAYDTQATVDHARLYDKEFAQAGIGRDRYCIKIPATGPALNAAKMLSQEGIPTLGTALFGLHQAIACSQAGCLYISPYYNENRAHRDLSVWPDVQDPATEHPNSPRIIHILETYKRLYKETGKEQPFVKLASFLSAKEAMAAAEMGCHSATISHTLLDQLAKLKYNVSEQPGEGTPKLEHPYKNPGPTPTRLAELVKIDPLMAKWDGKLASTSIDYLVNGGAELEKAIQNDPIATNRLAYALKLFIGDDENGETSSRKKCEEALAQV